MTPCPTLPATNHNALQYAPCCTAHRGTESCAHQRQWVGCRYDSSPVRGVEGCRLRGALAFQALVSSSWAKAITGHPFCSGREPVGHWIQ